MRVLEEFLKPTQQQLFKKLCGMYKGKTCVSKKSFILVRGDAPAMLLAHLDTVHAEPVRVICKSKNKDILMSPQGIGGDDRCGVYALAKVYKLAQVKPWLLFTCDEEIGGLGAKAFSQAHAYGDLPKEIDGMKLLVEIDRRGSNDAVYYGCDNLEFEKFITSKGFQTAYGSFSDISLIAPELGVAAVNLSSGYYNAHTPHEYIVRSELELTIERVVEIVADAAKDSFPKYSYVKKVYKSYDWRTDFFHSDRKYYGSLTKPRFEKDIVDVKPIEKLPSEYEQIYDELLDVYAAEELEEYREFYGDEILYQLYADEYGTFYAGPEK